MTAREPALIRGLDAIRFLCAFWVVMGHFGAPPLPSFVDKTTTPGGSQSASTIT